MNQDTRLQKLRGRVHVIACDTRNLSRVVDSEAFGRAWEVATDAQRIELEGYVTGYDKAKVDGWVKRVLSTISLEDKSFRELRDLAKAAGVMYYNNKTKEELIQELKP